MNPWMELTKVGYNPVVVEVKKCKCGSPRHIGRSGVEIRSCKSCMLKQVRTLIINEKERNKMAIDIMIDLETTGVSAGCGILSIGACTFDLKYKFYQKIDLKSCHHHGLVDYPDTIAWWERQHQIAKEEAFSGTKDLVLVLGEFHDWMRGIVKIEGDAFYWGNGADFDIPILNKAYEKAGMKSPLSYKPFNGRCFRTLKNLWKEVKADPMEGIAHTALADAMSQANHAMKILRIRKQQMPIV
jgi:hypothetical protein